MIEIGHRPILWHIMKIYTAHGLTDFIICCGYKGHIIKEYFANYFLSNADITFDIKNNKMEVHHQSSEPWRVTLVDTGENSMTGGRIKRVGKYLGNESFCLTYGDGVTDLDIKKLVSFHREQKTLATLTAVQPPGRFGAFALHQNQRLITSFREKPDGDGAYINGGFFVLEPQALDYIDGDDDCLGAGTNATSGPRKPVVSLQVRRLLAEHGYPPRQNVSGGSLGQRQRAVENLGPE